MANEKAPYVCGPLTELLPEEKGPAKIFYEAVGALCTRIAKVEAFVPHKHYDPVLHASYESTEVYTAEKKQICEHTSVIIVVALAPSWGGGGEVEMANERGIPVVILCDAERLERRMISRFLRGGPSIKAVIGYHTMEEALTLLAHELWRRPWHLGMDAGGAHEDTCGTLRETA